MALLGFVWRSTIVWICFPLVAEASRSRLGLRGPSTLLQSSSCPPPVQWRWLTEAREGLPELPARAVFSEITVRKSAPGTLNVVVGFNGGFLGTQEVTGPHERIVQFSLHDPEG